MAMSQYLQRLRSVVGRELLVLPSVTGIVFDDDNRILLVRQADVGVWSTPGGSIDPNETPADAVVREVWEETWLYTRPNQILGVFGGPMCEVTYPNGDRATYVTTAFECEVCGGSLTRVSDETTDAAFVGAVDVNRYPMTAWAQYVLPRLYDRSGLGRFEPPSWRPPAIR